MVKTKTESPIDTYFSVQNGDNSNFDWSGKNDIDLFIYINGSKAGLENSTRPLVFTSAS